MKHKKQLRKTQEDQKGPGDSDRCLESCSVNNMQEKNAADVKDALSPDTYTVDENEDEVDIEDDICSPEHLL